MPSARRQHHRPLGINHLVVGGLILLCGFNFPADELEFDGHSAAANDYCYNFTGDYNESDSIRCSEVTNVVEDRSGIRNFIKFIGFAVMAAGVIWAIAEASIAGREFRRVPLAASSTDRYARFQAPSGVLAVWDVS